MTLYQTLYSLALIDGHHFWIYSSLVPRLSPSPAREPGYEARFTLTQPYGKWQDYGDYWKIWSDHANHIPLPH